MDIFVARQPIFNRLQKLFGYELLFRDSYDNNYRCTNGDQATIDVICNSFFTIGIDTITGGKRAFINFTENLLLQEIPLLLSKRSVVIEILETVEPTPEVIAVCKKLKKAGYLIALDDFVFHPKFSPLLAVADIIKVDFLVTTGSERRKIMARVKNRNICFLAEKVETREDFWEAFELGYSYFQGYFFSKPIIFKGKNIPTNKLNQLRITKVLHELRKENFRFGSIEKFIMYDVSLSYQLLRFINSAQFSLSNEISSVKQALVLLGKNEINKWISLIIMRTFSNSGNDGIIITSLVRAKFCELFAKKVNLKERDSEFFMMGMFSLIDVFIGRPLKIILSELPISDDVKNALLGKVNDFWIVYDLIVAYEKVDWKTVAKHAATLSVAEGDIPDLYQQSVEWADDICALEV